MPKKATGPRNALGQPVEPKTPPADPQTVTEGGYTFTLAELFPESGLDAASDRTRDIDERLAALDAQKQAMRDGRRPLR